MSTDSTHRHTRLQKLSGSDFEIRDGEPDIRGWEVKDDTGRTIGEVEELIFDVQSQKVRYLVLDLEDNEIGLDDREVLVPIGIAQLHKEDDDVLLPGITVEQLAALPEYDEDRFDTDSEEGIRNVFGGLGAAALAGGSPHDDFYNHEHFDDSRLYQNRRSEVFDASDIPVIKEDWKVEEGRAKSGVGIQSKMRSTTDDADNTTYPHSGESHNL